MSTLEGFSDNAFIEKPASGWLHEDRDLIDGNSITYSIQYVGVVSVLESINSWKKETRTELIREAIVRLADHAQLIQANKKRKIPSKVKKALAAPNAQWRCECRLSINIDGFVIKHAVNKRELCKHPLNGVSFASGGDGATIDFVAYVGKEARTGRGCHIFECPRKAHLVLLTMGQAFDLAARRFKGRKGLPLTVPNDSWVVPGTEPSPSDYEAPMGRRSMKPSDGGLYDNGTAGRGDNIYDNRHGEPADYEPVTPSTAADYEMARASCKAGGTGGMFDDDIYETLKNEMAHSKDGVYDNLPGGHDGATGKGRPQKKKGDGTDEDLYGGIGERGEGLYDNTHGRRGMEYSDDGLYDNPHSMGQDGLYDNVAGKGRPQKKKGGGTDEDIYGGLGEREEGLYDNTRGEKGMKYSEDGLYDNPHNMGQDGLYDNVAARGRAQKKRGDGMNEDIYGGLGAREEGLYDDTRGEKGMKYSEDGLYDNPHNMGQDGLYDNVAARGRAQKKRGGGTDEDIYGGLGEREEGLYDDTRGEKGMRYSEDGLYDNPHAGKGGSDMYDNPARQKQRGQQQGTGVEEDIYGGVWERDEGVYDDTTGGGRAMKRSEEGIYDNPHNKGKEGIYDNPAMKRTPHAALKGMSGKGPEEDIYGEVGEGEAGIYDDTTGGGRGMKHSEDGIYDNPHAEGKEGIYDNPAMKRTPHAALKGMSGKGPEEDVYGEVGEAQGGEGIYDDPKMVGKGGKMDFSDTGIYDNPLAANGQAGEEGVYEGIPADFIEKEKAGPEEDIYGGAGDVVGGDGIYDNPHIVTGGNAPGSKDQGMAYTGDGIYDNPEAIMQDDPLYDNKEGVMTKAEGRLGHFRRQPEFDRSIYGQSPRAARKVLQGPKERWPLIHQSWFHGKVERIEAEALLEGDGDFLVRESKKKEGQYVLTALVGKQPQHLVLVDPQGKVKAKDHEFASVSELVYHFMDKKAPLFLGKTEVFLKRPIENVFPKASMDDDGESIYQTTAY